MVCPESGLRIIGYGEINNSYIQLTIFIIHGLASPLTFQCKFNIKYLNPQSLSPSASYGR